MALTERAREFECTACGNCCANTCSHKVGNLCDVHPSIVGEEVARELRGMKCHIDPLEVMSWEYYCGEVATDFERRMGIKVIPKPSPLGYVSIANRQEVFAVWDKYLDEVRPLDGQKRVAEKPVRSSLMQRLRERFER